MLAIIGGTGLSEVSGFGVLAEHGVQTPFGDPSSSILEGEIDQSGNRFLFLPRHGSDHTISPSEVNYRANIWALKKRGATQILSVGAVGSLQETIPPGSLVLINQYIDHTKGLRARSFFSDGIVAHINMARPVCPHLRHDLLNGANTMGISIMKDITYGCIEGPSYNTRAESLYLKNTGCDVVGMTNLPEAQLAREAQMSYASLCIVTDYDSWREETEVDSKAQEIVNAFQQRIQDVKSIIHALSIMKINEPPTWIRSSLHGAIVTHENKITAKHKKWLDVLRT